MATTNHPMLGLTSSVESPNHVLAPRHSSGSQQSMKPRLMLLLMAMLPSMWGLDVVQRPNAEDLAVADLTDPLVRAYPTEWMRDSERLWTSILWRMPGGIQPREPQTISGVADLPTGGFPFQATVDAQGYAVLRWPLDAPSPPLQLHLDGIAWPHPGISVPPIDTGVPSTCWLGELDPRVLAPPEVPTRVNFHLVMSKKTSASTTVSCQVISDTPPKRSLSLTFQNGMATAELPPGWCTLQSANASLAIHPMRLFIPVSRAPVDHPVVAEPPALLHLRRDDGTPQELSEGRNTRLMDGVNFTIDATVHQDTWILRTQDGLLGYQADADRPSLWGTSIDVTPKREGTLTLRSTVKGKPTRLTLKIDRWDASPERQLTPEEITALIPSQKLLANGSKNLKWGEPFDGLLWADGLGGYVQIPAPPAKEPGCWYLHVLASSGEHRPIALEVDGCPLAVMKVPAKGGFEREKAHHTVAGPLWLDAHSDIILRAKGYMPHLESLIWVQEAQITWSLETRDRVGIKPKASPF